ncbi:MAG: hypothetical protein AB1742_11225 [bacterium]
MTMRGEKADRAGRIAGAVVPFCEKPLKEELEGGIISSAGLLEILRLLKDAFEEIGEEDCMENIVEKRIRQAILKCFELDAREKIGDPMLEKCVEIIRENLVRKTEREALSRNLAADLKTDWMRLPEDRLEKIKGDEGLLGILVAALEGGAAAGDDRVVKNLLELGAILWEQYIVRFDDKELDTLLRDGIEILKKIEKKHPFGEELLEWTRRALNRSGVIGIMRKSFTRLLLGDLILHSVGKGLGLKEKTTVTDFIVLVGVRLAEKRIRDEADAGEVRKLRVELEKIP